MKSYKFSVVIEKDKDGYFAFVPNFKAVTRRVRHTKRPSKTSRTRFICISKTGSKAARKSPRWNPFPLTSLEVAV